jgi:hypothetical protein
MTRLAMKHSAAIVALAAIGLTAVGSAATSKFFDDDPIWVERDTQDASGMKSVETSLFVDIAANAIRRPTTQTPVRAENVNSVDEVPDSSWFTNRAGRLALSPADIEAGPNTTTGPARGPWIITSSKSDGVTPGFTVKDSRGERWFLKFDPPGYRAMSTGTEVTVTKLMWALGYNVPENHIAYLRAEQLVVGDGAKFTPQGAKPRAMRADDVGNLLKRANQEPDGSYRVVASRALPGKPIGRVRFYGTRPDDPNDIVPHENRRELRGYSVFAAWVNHVDAKSINSLDTLVDEVGRAHVRTICSTSAPRSEAEVCVRPITGQAKNTCSSRAAWRSSSPDSVFRFRSGTPTRITNRRQSVGSPRTIPTSILTHGSRAFAIRPF